MHQTAWKQLIHFEDSLTKWYSNKNLKYMGKTLRETLILLKVKPYIWFNILKE